MSETGERGPKKRRLSIATAAGPIVVLVPADASVADACAAVEARLRGSGHLGKRRIRTLLLPELGELGAADSLADAVEDGEELRPVFEDADAEDGPDKRAGGQGAGPGEELRPVLEQAGAEGGPDERAGGEGAGQGEAKRRRVEAGQGAPVVSGSPEGAAQTSKDTPARASEVETFTFAPVQSGGFTFAPAQPGGFTFPLMTSEIKLDAAKPEAKGAKGVKVRGKKGKAPKTGARDEGKEGNSAENVERAATRVERREGMKMRLYYSDISLSQLSNPSIVLLI